MEQVRNQINDIAYLAAGALRRLSGDGESGEELLRLAAGFEADAAAGIGDDVHVKADEIGAKDAGAGDSGVEGTGADGGRADDVDSRDGGIDGSGTADDGSRLLRFAARCGETAELLLRLGAGENADPVAVGECAALLEAAFQTALLRVYASGSREADPHLARRRNSRALALKKKYVPRLAELAGEMEDALLFDRDGCRGDAAAEGRGSLS